MSLTVASLHLYPIKSVGGISVGEARFTDRGFAHDRRWMLVDAKNRFITQREQPLMALLRCSEQGEGFRVTDIRTGEWLDLPWSIDSSQWVDATVFDDSVRVLAGSAEWSTWFSARLGSAVRLTYMPDASQRTVDARYAAGINSLSDGFPYLVLSQASLDDLNARLVAPVPMDRFRPNIVIAGGSAYQEDSWRAISIGTSRFILVKPCGRCVITTTDQQTGARDKEPLRTLASYRSLDGKVIFGMNAMGEGQSVRVGDLVAL